MYILTAGVIIHHLFLPFGRFFGGQKISDDFFLYFSTDDALGVTSAT